MDDAKHAEVLVNRIVEFGALPTANPSDIEKNANIAYPKYPEYVLDYIDIIRTIIETKERSVAVYERIAGYTMDKDRVSCELVTCIAAEELKHIKTLKEQIE